MWRLSTLLIVAAGWCALAQPASAQLQSREIIRLLNEQIDVKDFQQPMTFKEFFGLLYEKYQAKGHDLPLLVDGAGFAREEVEFYENQILMPPYPKVMSAMAALRLALSQSPVEATYLIRQGRIDIVPASRATLPHLLKQRITADFSRMPFTEVVHALAEMTGVSIQIDGRLASAKELPAVTATFRNDMALRDVLHVVAGLAGARVTELETGVVISAAADSGLPAKTPPKKNTPPHSDTATSFITADGQADAAAAPEKRPVAKTGASAELLRRLREPIDAKSLQQPMTLKEMLGIVYQTFQDRGAELPILIDQQAFKEANPDAPDLYETQVTFPPFPKQLTLAQALKLALSQVPTANATYWIRDNFIEITTREALAFDRLKARFVHGQFTRQPAHDVIIELADQSGVTVVIDSRVEDKLNVPVTLTLRNNVSVHDALRTLADMAGLRLVELPTSFYVTGISSPLAEEARQTRHDLRPAELGKDCIALPVADLAGLGLGLGEAAVPMGLQPNFGSQPDLGGAVGKLPKALLQTAGPAAPVAPVAGTARQQVRAAPLAREPRPSASAEALKKLEQPWDVNFEAPTKFRDMIETWEKRGMPRVIVYQHAFRLDNPDAPDIYETQILLPRVQGLPAAKVFRMALDQIPTADATYLVQSGHLLVTTNQNFTPRARFVQASFANRPLDEALDELSDLTGIAIALDPRVGDKGKTPITARFPSETNLAQIVRVLADMADLKAVVVDTMVYVTSRDNDVTFPEEPPGPGKWLRPEFAGL